MPAGTNRTANSRHYFNKHAAAKGYSWTLRNTAALLLLLQTQQQHHHQQQLQHLLANLKAAARQSRTLEQQRHD
jgi:hypothetical protein